MDKDLTSQISSIKIETRKSQKSNKDYSVLTLLFKNGYKHETFLNNEQLFILGQIADSAKATGNH